MKPRTEKHYYIELVRHGTKPSFGNDKLHFMTKIKERYLEALNMLSSVYFTSSFTITIVATTPFGRKIACNLT